MTAATVTTSFESAYYGATEGRVCEVVRAYHRNGEDHLSLRDVKTGETFESPEIFWSETKEGAA